MRQEAAALQLWLAHEEFARERHDLQLAERALHPSDSPALRRRVGQAVIALGERLAGDARDAREPRVLRDAREAAARANLAARPS